MRSWAFFLRRTGSSAPSCSRRALALGNDYLFFAGYVVLQYIVLATAWNILGGYCGYVNFGSAAFFALGAYSSVALHKLGANIDRYPPASSPTSCTSLLPLSIPVHGAGRRHRLRHRRLGHGLPDAAAARGVLRHRHAGHGRGAADADHQLGFRRRLARRLRHPAGQASRSALLAQLHRVSVPDHARARRVCR